VRADCRAGCRGTPVGKAMAEAVVLLARALPHESGSGVLSVSALSQIALGGMHWR
jgi:hypothetical protein